MSMTRCTGDTPTSSPAKAPSNPWRRWEEIKKAEKADYSPVSHVPEMLPALLRAFLVSKRAARVGFDWEKLDDIYQKMYEEIGELKEAEASHWDRRDRGGSGGPSLYHGEHFTGPWHRSGNRIETYH